jgi:gas vesicle protein
MVISFLFGLFVGVTVGVFVAGLMCAAGKGNNSDEQSS